MKNWVYGLAASVGAAAGLALFAGCEVDSASDVQRNVGVDFTGFYRNSDGSPITTRNSGSPIMTLDLRQGGDRLEAVDNHGKVWKGSIGEFNGSVASFDLKGQTTAGTEGLFSGSLTSSENAESTASQSNATSRALGTMTGTYIEDAFYATFRGAAIIPGTPPDPPDDNNTNTNGIATNSNFVVRAVFDAKGLAANPPPGLWFMLRRSS